MALSLGGTHHPLGDPLRRHVGAATAAKLAKHLELHTLGDLLRHYPRRYVERGEVTAIADLAIGDDVTVIADVKTSVGRAMRNRPGTIREVVVTDGTDELKLTFFGKKRWTAGDKLAAGMRGMFSGVVGTYRDQRQLTHPAFVVLDGDPDDPDAIAFTEELIPLYPATAAVRSWEIQRCVRAALDVLGELPDPLPATVRADHRLVPLAQAFQLVHRPSTFGDVGRAAARLRWDEAFVLQAALAQRRRATRALPAVPRRAAPDGLLAAFDDRLQFSLTDGQRTVGDQIAADLARDYPMHRLLQGEVGSGKTLVALRAILAVVDAGGQAALLAPTEVLAQQHYASLTALLGPLAEAGRLGGDDRGTQIAVLTGSMTAPARRAALLAVAAGDAGIVVGTHALLEDRVDFSDLGLVVIDEQHRFGVEQRDALRAKAAKPPHLLVMTATPIPRTVAMTVFGDLDVSTLTELPAGRSPIRTHVVPSRLKPHYLDRAWQVVRDQVAAGHQAYVVCPRIGEAAGPGADEDDDGRVGAPAAPDAPEDLAGQGGGTASRRPPAAVAEVAPELGEGPLAGLRVGVLHGRLAREDSEAVMAEFSEGRLDVLVATTVIEVGVDVPNATVMAILDADRFGISQLHQLRGRVGRGSAAGICFLVTDADLGSPALTRLEAVASTTDGFELSRLDLEARREGDVLGATQSGRRSSLRMLAVIRDAEVIADARTAATEVVDADPELERHPALAAALADLLDADRAEFLDKT